MKILVIKVDSKRLSPRNFCIYDQRRRGHMKFKDIAKVHGISTERARQIYLFMDRAYTRGMFTYEDTEK